MRRTFLAFLGPAERGSAVADIAARCGLAPVAVAPDLLLFVGDGIATSQLPDGTRLLGEIFSLSGATCSAPAEGWGNYLAFSREDSGQRITRAPLTGMPIYWARYDDGVLCGSDLEILTPLLPDTKIDWDFIAQSLVHINLRTDRTGVGGLSELLAGTRLDFDGRSVAVTPVWSPWDHVEKADPRGVSELAPELERRIIKGVDRWSASRHSVLLELSGGLDSSIVGAALAASGTEFSAITFVTPGADGDERYYARRVAEHLGIELVEMPHDATGIDLVALPTYPLPRPGAYSALGGIDRAFCDVVRDPDVSIFGGIGGDNIFEFDGTVAPILDAFDTFGLGSRSVGVLRDIARAGGATIWEAARLARRARRAGPRLAWRRDVDYLNPGALPAQAFPHPWDEGAAAASQAKRNHVHSLRRIVDFLDRPGRWHGRDVVTPLLSQPVVELCLSIPSWTWFTGGRDRAVARAAFASHLPAEIVWRRGKGRLESLCGAAYLAQRGALRELVLGGRLAERGLLDLPRIEAYLRRDLVERDFDYFRLIEIGDIERWVRAAEAGFGPSIDQR
ncbi:asparagine synthase C-terminal domain-containing protein [Sphingopyxis granuli]|uniref:asparagine synthase C-terminal domain-containing protein n=1 Tax=Sphingopyxis granuli TaxID=267128 RepID=UPI00301C8737